MITRPSTSRVLEDVVEELTRDIMPMITDPAQQIRLHMLMIVLNDCVNASEREISVMRSEIAEYLAFAGDVAKARAMMTLQRQSLGPRWATPSSSPMSSANTGNASRAFSTAMDLVMDSINRDFIARGEAFLKTRVVNERAILSGSSAVGRSAS